MASMLRDINFVVKGLREFTRQAYEARAARFDAADASISMAGKTVVVTGANAGLGRAAAEALCARGARVVAVCRSEARGRKAVEEIGAAAGTAAPELKICDMSSLPDVERLASDLSEGGAHVDVLINNAGVLNNTREETPGGAEASFATNVLGTLALTERLIPALRRAPGGGRVVTVSSGGMYSEKLRAAGFEHRGRKWDGVKAYAVHKRQQVALTEAWQRAYGGGGECTFVSMHPGWALTEGVQKSLPDLERQVGKGKLRTAAMGADTMVWLAAVPRARLEPAAFYLDRAPQRKHLALGFGTGYGDAQADALRAELARMAGVEGVAAGQAPAAAA